MEIQDKKFIIDAEISGLRLGGYDHLDGLVLEKEGQKKILRIALETKRGIFGHRITGAHFELEDYW